MAADRSAVQVVAGNDELRVKEGAAARADELRRTLKLDGEWGVEICDGWVESSEGALAAVRDFVQRLGGGSLFGGDRRLVWLRNVNFLADPRVARLGDVEPALEMLAGSLEGGLGPDVTVLLSVLNPDKRRTFWKRIDKVATVTLCDLPTARDLPDASAQDVEAFFKREGRRVRGGVADELVRLCTDDPRRLMAECEKIFVYAGEDPEITAEHVAAIASTSREESGWGLADAVVAGQWEQALTLLGQLRFQSKKDDEAVPVMSGVAAGVRLAMQCRVLQSRNWIKAGSFSATWTKEAEDILSRNKDGKGPAPFVVAKAAAQAAKRPGAYWLALHALVVETYAGFFDGTADRWTKLEMLVVKAAQIAGAKARA
jgi:DNA polymerase-3 subunit delta